MKKLLAACYVRKLRFDSDYSYQEYLKQNPTVYDCLERFTNPDGSMIVTLCFTYNNATPLAIVAHAKLSTYMLEEVDYNGEN